jgi:hypothetical protein
MVGKEFAIEREQIRVQIFEYARQVNFRVFRARMIPMQQKGATGQAQENCHILSFQKRTPQCILPAINFFRPSVLLAFE